MPQIVEVLRHVHEVIEREDLTALGILQGGVYYRDDHQGGGGRGNGGNDGYGGGRTQTKQITSGGTGTMTMTGTATYTQQATGSGTGSATYQYGTSGTGNSSITQQYGTSGNQQTATYGTGSRIGQSGVVQGQSTFTSSYGNLERSSVSQTGGNQGQSQSISQSGVRTTAQGITSYQSGTPQSKPQGSLIDSRSLRTEGRMTTSGFINEREGSMTGSGIVTQHTPSQEAYKYSTPSSTAIKMESSAQREGTSGLTGMSAVTGSSPRYIQGSSVQGTPQSSSGQSGTVRYYGQQSQDKRQ